MVVLMYTLEVEIVCDNLGIDDCNIIKKALEPDNIVSELLITITCKDSVVRIEISGERIGSVRAAYNDLARALAPLLNLILVDLSK